MLDGFGLHAHSRVILTSARSEFYREEFTKHRRCLQQQREYFSESAVTEAVTALSGILVQLEWLCSQDDANELLSCLLRQFDKVTRLSALSDPRNVH